MSVRRKLVAGMTMVVACAALVGGAGVAGLFSLNERYEHAEEQYAELRTLYEVGHGVALARLHLNGDRMTEASRALDNASSHARSLPDTGHDLAQELSGAAKSLAEAGDASGGRRQGLSDVNRWLAEIATLASDRERNILRDREAITSGLVWMRSVLTALLVATVIVAGVIGVSLYRSVTRPLATLNRAMGAVGGHTYSHRIPERGDVEFQRLAQRFNDMSAAIEGLHASMQQQVEVKSRQLVRSESLAGVGVLAAGLAHEINNPLAIMTGYSQMALRRLASASESGEMAEALRRAETALNVVCEEAFRCRGIASQLLELARPGNTRVEQVDVAAVVGRAVDLVGALPIAAGTAIELDDAAAGATSNGNPGELLQVVINLLTNALEACAPGSGRVEVSVTRSDRMVAVSVADNGCGMDEQAAAHAFEPFFTDKPRRGLSGCGLGLSVSHAIIERHGGRLFALSDGPGRGSTFTIELPLAVEVGTDVESHHGALT